MNHKAHLVWYRLLGILLVIPNTLSEWFNTLTDIGSYQGNVALIRSITSYKPTAIQTLFDRSFDSLLFAQIGAVFFILLHLLAAVLMTVGIVLMIKHIRSAKGLFREHVTFATAGLVLIIVSFALFFGVVAMDYFMSQLHGFNYNSQLTAVLLPAGIALLYLLAVE